MNLQCVGSVAKSADVMTSCADLHADVIDLRMRQLEEFVEQAELVHHFERRGMHGVAAEIAQEIGVLFQHRRLRTPARASRKPSIMPAGPPPAMQQVVLIDATQCPFSSKPVKTRPAWMFRGYSTRPATPASANVAIPT